MSSENVDERKKEEQKSVLSQMEEKKWDQTQIKIRQWKKRRRRTGLLPPFISVHKQQHEVNINLLTSFIYN